MYLSHLEKLGRTRIEDVLVDEGILERQRVEEAQAEQESSGRQLGEILISKEIVSDYDFAKLVATHYALPYLDVSSYSTRREMFDTLPVDYCLQHGLLPLDQFGATITLAVCEMPTPELIDEVVAKTNLTPFLFVAVRRAMMNVLDEEKKRGPRRTTQQMKLPPKPAPAPAPAASPKSEPVAAAPASPAAVAAPAPKSEPVARAEEPLPDLDSLPLVSMKLVSGGPRMPPAPARTVAGKEPIAPARPAAAKAAPPAAPAPDKALSWMDAVGGSAAPKTGPVGGSASPKSGPVAEPSRPKISKFPVPSGGAPAAKETTAPARPAAPSPISRPISRPVTGPTSPSVAKPATAPPKPAAQPSVPATKEGAGWQSIFDIGDASVKKEKPR